MVNSTTKSPWGRSSREQDRENKREAVLRTAAHIFNERGYHGTSLELVAEELEITRPTVYYYFKNKDEILFECVRIALEMIEQVSQDVMERGGSASEQLVAVMKQYAEVMMQDFGICLMRVGDSPLPAESRVKLRRLQANIDRKLRGLIEQGIRQKAFVPCDPKLASFALAGALNSISRWYRPDGELTPQEIADHFVHLLIGGLELRSAGARAVPAPVHVAARPRLTAAARVKKGA